MSEIQNRRKRNPPDEEEDPSDRRIPTKRRDDAVRDASDEDENDDDDDDTSKSSCEQVLSCQEHQNGNDAKQLDNRVKRRKTAKFKKHPDAPKRFRSAFIIFSQQRHKELRAKLNAEGGEIDTMNIAGQISDEWRTLGLEAKRIWEEMAHKDKERYQREKAQYAGPWKVRTNLRKPKDPNSPKKPVPAYFAFSNERRQEVKNMNPNATNGEISRMLSKMWKEAPAEVRTLYLDKEAQEREKYTENMTEWKENKKREITELLVEGSKEEVDKEGDTKQHPSNFLVEGTTCVQGVGTVSSGVHDQMLPGVNVRQNVPGFEQTRRAFSDVRDDGRVDLVRLDQSSTSNTFDAYTRLLHDSILQQAVLGSTLLQQRSQNLMVNRDSDLLLRLLSRTPLPQQSNNDREVLRHLMMSAGHGRNFVDDNYDTLFGSSAEAEHLRRVGDNFSSGAAPFGGGQLGDLVIPPGWLSNLQHAAPSVDPTSLGGIMSLYNRQRLCTGTGAGVGLIDPSLLRQIPGSGTGVWGGPSNFAISGGSGFSAEDLALFRILEHQQQQLRLGEHDLSTSSSNGTININNQSSLPRGTNEVLVEYLLRQLRAAGGSIRESGLPKGASPP